MLATAMDHNRVMSQTQSQNGGLLDLDVAAVSDKIGCNVVVNKANEAWFSGQDVDPAEKLMKQWKESSESYANIVGAGEGDYAVIGVLTAEDGKTWGTVILGQGDGSCQLLGDCDSDAPKAPYYSGNHISCKSVSQCGCSGKPQCSSCPNGGSGNVCWCADAYANGSGQNECSPSAPGGPYKIDVDAQGYSYDPIMCRPGQTICKCDLGTPKCSQCPFDNRSQKKDDNVCWCDFQGTYTEGFYPYNDNPYGECNPEKYKGPTRR